jgi:nucleoside-diphosphate-sugar epimerase
LPEKEFIMHCFIAGVSGFIGSIAAEQLLAKSHIVSVLTCDKTKNETLVTTGIEPFVGDLRQPRQWVNHLRDAETDIHLAILPIRYRPGSRYVRELLEVQKLITRRVLEAILDACKAFVHAIGVFVYGAHQGVHDESTEIEPCHIAAPYAAGEKLVLHAALEKGIAGIVLRLADVYGFGGIFGRFWSGPMKYRRRTGISGKGKQTFSFVHIEDWSRAFVRCVEYPMPGEIFNVAENEPVPLGNIISSCAMELQSPPPLTIYSSLFKLIAGTIVGESLLLNKAASNRKMLHQMKVELKNPAYKEVIAASANEAGKTTALVISHASFEKLNLIFYLTY